MNFVKRCPKCKSVNLFHDKKRSEVICKDCGLVVEEEIIDPGQEWREFGDDESSGRRRAGAPLTFTKHDSGLGTEVGSDSEIYKLDPLARRKFQRLKKWHGRASTSVERNLKYALVELKRMASILNLPPSIEEEAARVYNLIVRKGLVRGRSVEAVVVGTLYVACRQFNLARSLNELSKLSNVNKREIGKNARYITRNLGIKLIPTNAEEYIPKFAHALKFPAETRAKAIELVEKTQTQELTSGRGPPGIAAAALYVAALLTGTKVTQREIAEVIGVTEVTIRNRYKEIVEYLKLEEQIEKLKEKQKKGEGEGG